MNTEKEVERVIQGLKDFERVARELTEIEIVLQELEELERVLQELQKPLNKDERYKLECMQLQLEFEIDYADAVEIVNNRDLLM